MAGEEEGLRDELELLRAMWPDPEELEVRESPAGAGAGAPLAAVTARLAPLTAGQEGAQFVRCEVLIEVPVGYPAAALRVTLGSSRGLPDEHREALLAELRDVSLRSAGEQALYLLLEAAREALTNINAPAGECAICLGSLEDGSPSEEAEGPREVQGLRTPCFHAFHARCFADYWRSEGGRQLGPGRGLASAEVACPECRAVVPWTTVPQLRKLLGEGEPEPAEGEQEEEASAEPLHEAPAKAFLKPSILKAKLAPRPAPSLREEAFVRLHHLWQGSDEKERPLLRLLKELGLDAVIFYGRPAMLHIQGDEKDVNAFVGAAKRRHITVTIEVAQRSRGPPIPEGATAVFAKKGSLDGDAFGTHLEKRGLGESAYSILGR